MQSRQTRRSTQTIILYIQAILLLSMRRLLVWFLCLAAFTSLHWFARRLNRPSSASFSVNRLTHDAQCKMICEECAFAAEYKQVYEGFPLELPALPRFASDLNSSRLSQALHVIVITDDCTIFNGRSLRGPPAVWKYLSQAVKVTSELCVGTAGASQPDTGESHYACPSTECGTPDLFAHWALRLVDNIALPNAVLFLLPTRHGFDYAAFSSLTLPILIAPQVLGYDGIISVGITNALPSMPVTVKDEASSLSQVYAGELAAFRALSQPVLSSSEFFNHKRAFIVPNDGMKASLIENYYLPSDAVSVLDVVHTIDVDRVAAIPKAAARMSLYMPSDAFIVGIWFPPEEYSREKQHNALLRLFLDAVTSSPGSSQSLAVFVIGSGDYSAAMSGTDRTGTKRAHSLSPADQREVTAFYSAIDVFLDLSTFTIGFRYLALEALAHGTPAVVPDTVVVPSYSCGAVLRYQPGYMTEAVKQLRQVQSNPITYQSTAKACAAEFADAEATHALLHKQLSSIAKSA